MSYIELLMKDTSITIKVTEEMKKDLAKLAAADRRTLSDFIRLHLEKLLYQA